MKTRSLTLLGIYLAALSACASVAPPIIAPPLPVAAAPAMHPIRPAEQWLFGSAEATVIMRQSYEALTGFALDKARSQARKSVVIETSATLTSPTFADCGPKPAAVVFDADETLIWNVGQARWAAENGMAFDPKVWDEWERTGEGKVLAIPGAVEAVAKLRAAGVAIVVNTNREARNAGQTAATLKTAGFGDFVHGETLFLKGDDASGSSKDVRRAAIASQYCVIAMVGDQLGDFAQGFNDKTLTVAQRRALTAVPQIASLWGKGWFLLPNSTYGPWDRTRYDDIFPGETRWEPKETK